MDTNEQKNQLTRDEIERLLIEYLASSKVSEETILPIILMRLQEANQNTATCCSQIFPSRGSDKYLH